MILIASYNYLIKVILLTNQREVRREKRPGLLTFKYNVTIKQQSILSETQNYRKNSISQPHHPSV